MEILEQLLLKINKSNPSTAQELDNLKRQFMRVHKQAVKQIPRKKDLLKVYHKLLKQNKFKANKQLEKLLIKRAVRTLSGVTIITVLAKPGACPGKCVYCPTEPGMPKSYLADEPAAARAFKLKFDPFQQVACRMATLTANGHPTDKIELIVKGGTWNAYPLKYQYWFILRCFQACNQPTPKTKSKTPSYLADNLSSLPAKLRQAQTKNEQAQHRIIGLTLETRPDMIDDQTIKIMRELGCTRLELGVQTTDNKILQLVQRGHDKISSQQATKLLKNYGFKVDYHLMPQLPGSTHSQDLKMLREIFSNPAYRPDMIKIYPCTVIANTKLHQWLKQGKYKPYPDKKLIGILIKFKSSLPYYVRISRLIRDIPSQHVQAGNKLTNLRQIIQRQMKEQGLKCRCLRCREIGHSDDKKLKNQKPKLFIDQYEASDGVEYFLSYEDKNREIVYAFCRLRICHSPDSLYPAYIRELHTYGQSLNIGQKQNQASQHKGLGKELIKQTVEICRINKIKKVAVISGVGVRGYYRKLGYRLQNGYMVKKLN